MNQMTFVALRVIIFIGLICIGGVSAERVINLGNTDLTIC
jgi:hypothetical protein